MSSYWRIESFKFNPLTEEASDFEQINARDMTQAYDILHQLTAQKILRDNFFPIALMFRRADDDLRHVFWQDSRGRHNAYAEQGKEVQLDFVIAGTVTVTVPLCHGEGT
jgi:hypothetical protein